MPDFLRVSPTSPLPNDRLTTECSTDDFLQQSSVEVCRSERPGDNESNNTGLWCLSPSVDNSSWDSSIVPANDHAERYFSTCLPAVSSPGFDHDISHVMDGSTVDIGTSRPEQLNSDGWTLVGNIAYSRPSLPIGRRNWPLFEPTLRCGLDSSRWRPSDPVDAMSCTRPVDLDVFIECSEPNSLESTPSPSTHDLILVDGQYLGSKSIPYVDDDLTADGDEVFGVV